MARAQTWARNISKKIKKAAAPDKIAANTIVDDEPLKRLKRRAEDLGLILHAQTGKKMKGRKK